VHIGTSYGKPAAGSGTDCSRQWCEQSVLISMFSDDKLLIKSNNFNSGANSPRKDEKRENRQTD